MKLHTAIKLLEPYRNGYWGGRICAEIACLKELSRNRGGMYDDMVASAAKDLLDSAKEHGAITKNAALACETALIPLSKDIKKLTVHAVGHAHIDMNWLWRYDETVSITLETFRTVLKLMKDFPDFKFSQSQASCYRIVEKYDPALLDEIRQAVNSGRWEVSAATWVEADKNMTSGESQARHILYTKRYINKLFGLPEDALRLDFEPDTFGHAAHTPEILNAGGVDFYFHCRGYDGHEIYNWRSPSGASVLAYRSDWFYNGTVEPGRLVNAPAFCARNGVSDMLLVYGCGDHGGGPTRRDLESVVDMSSWPLAPDIRFSSFREYYNAIEPLKTGFPFVDAELNFVFTGCYSAQSRIKAANRLSEASLFEAEALSALSPVGTRPDPFTFEEAWRDVLFNHFHDILPGAGVQDTREHARGLFQEVLARANSQKGIICHAIAKMVDTSAVGGGHIPEGTRSEGAGAGYGVERSFGLSRVERGIGLRRGYLLFNMAGNRSDVNTITIWDWPGDRRSLRITDGEGNTLTHQILEDNIGFWGHEGFNLAVQCPLPSMGWKLIIADEDKEADDAPPPAATPPNPVAPRVHKPYEYILENDVLRAEFDSASGGICSLTDKRTGKIAATEGGFYGFTESPNVSNPAWMIGRYMNDKLPVIIEKAEWGSRGALRNAVKFTGRYKSSKIEYIVSLDKGAEYLEINAVVDWLEPGSAETGMPQLHFKICQANPSAGYLYDIPMGTAVRPATDMDMPGLTYVCSLPDGAPAIAVLSRDKYGYRCNNGVMSLTLIHSSYRPDPFPELYRHNFTFSVAVPADTTPEQMGALSMRLNHPAFAQSVPAHPGSLSAEHSMMECGAAVSCVKSAEDGSGDLIIRLYDNKGLDHEATVTLASGVIEASLCSLTENPVKPLDVKGSKLIVPLKKHGCATVRARTNRAYSPPATTSSP